VGDGVADLVGRPFGRTRWPWSAKTLIGSAAFVVGALLANFAFVALFVRLGYFAHVPWVSRRLQLQTVQTAAEYFCCSTAAN